MNQNETQNEATQEQGADQNQEKHVLDMGFDVQMEDDGYLGDDPFFNPFAQEQGQEEIQQQSQEDQEGDQTGEASQEGTGSDELIFEDVTNDEGEQEPDEDELIQKLKAKGYNVEKPEDPSHEKTTQIKELDGRIQGAKDFLENRSEEERIKIGAINELKSKYQKEKKAHLIDSEIFEEELNQFLAEIEHAGYVAKSAFLKGIDGEVKEYLRQLEGNKNKLQTELDQANREQMVQQRTALQESMKRFHKEGFLGQEVQPEVAKKAYDRIVSGQLQKDVSSNHDLISEFALYLELKANLAEQLGQPSYGEGVAAAKNHILNGDRSSASQNPLDNAMRSGKGAGNLSQGVPNINGRFKSASGNSTGENVVEEAGRFS